MDIPKILSATWPGWKIVREIGAGTHGTVCLMRHQPLIYGEEEYCAIKVLQLTGEHTNHEKNQDALREEALMWQFSGYRNTVHLYESKVFNDDEQKASYLLLRMELLLPLEEYKGFDFFKVGVDICSALSALHQQNIYHMDVKPNNIFVCADGSFKLGDFGTARSKADLEQGVFPIGTRHYAAPELLDSNKGYLTAGEAIRADIFSLGMVLFELDIWDQFGRGLHGPWEYPDEREEWFSIQRHFCDNYPCNKGEERSVQDVIKCAVSANPSGRYRSADEMLKALLSVGPYSMEGYRSQLRKEYGPSEPTICESLNDFINKDVRSILMLCYPSGMHRNISSCSDSKSETILHDIEETSYFQYVDFLSGIQMDFYGHQPPVAIFINGNEIPFYPESESVYISFRKLFQDCTLPLSLDIVVQYPSKHQFRWRIRQDKPSRHWEWFKCPDWT